MLFKPINIKFWKYDVNEHCKDSKSYLEDLVLLKINLPQKCLNNQKILLVAVDLQGLYPNISRELVKISSLSAIKKCTNYSKQVNKILVDLTMLCFEIVIA